MMSVHNEFLIAQQQYKCLDGRMKLIEMKMENMSSQMEDFIASINKNVMALDDLRATQSASQQNSDAMALQIKEIQNTLQQMSSLRVNDSQITNRKVDLKGKPDLKSKIDLKAQPTTLNSTQDKQLNEMVSKAPKGSNNIRKVTHRHKITGKTLEEISSSDESTIISRDELYSSHGIGPIPHFGKSKSARRVDEMKQSAKFMQADNITKPQETTDYDSEDQMNDRIQEKLNNIFSEMPAKFGEKELEMLEDAQQMIDKNVKLLEYELNQSGEHSMSIMGEGCFGVKENGKDLLLVFISDDTTISFWIRNGSKFQRVGRRKIIFGYYERVEGRGVEKFAVAVFSDPSIAEFLGAYFDKNCEKAVQEQDSV